MNKHKQTSKHLRQDQSGLVSFIVVSVLMLVVTLFVLSFARIVSREQIQTMDRQLNTQALYAAESGVNDAMHALKDQDMIDGAPYEKCDEFKDKATTEGITISSTLGDNVSYSCLLVDPNPTQLEYDGINTQESTVIPIEAKGGSTISKIEISWDGYKPGAKRTGCPNSTNNQFQISWPANCEIGILRMELLPFSGSLTRDDIITNHAVGFFLPNSAVGVGSVNRTTLTQSSSFTNNKGEVRLADCNSSANIRKCRMNITGVNMTKGYLRLRSIYHNTPVTIRIFESSDLINPIPTKGAQVAIDVTGRAGGVLKRIKVQRPLPGPDSKDIAPEFALQSHDSLCKRFTHRPNETVSSIPGGYNVTNAQCSPLQP